MTTAALAERPTAPSPGARIPLEFIGQARALRQRIDRENERYEKAAERLIKPFRPADRWHPMPRVAMLEELGQRWRGLPAVGRLRATASCNSGKLSITEMRVEPSRLKIAAWQDELGEPAVSIILRMISISPPRFSDRTRTAAIFGLHALARRHERGANRTAQAVLEDMKALGLAYHTVLKAEDEFAIPAPGGGRWIGSVMVEETWPLLCVRTYVGC
jgi:hypothetical protein